jgi:5S rRNA maturation endonuclease (ribonuclease M5)
MSIQFDKMIEFLSEYGKIYIHGNNINMKCPLCGDSKKSSMKKRFHAKFDNGEAYYSCFNCSKSGTLVELYSELKGVSIVDAIRTLDTPDFNKIKEKITPKPTITKQIEKKPELNYILDDCVNVYSEVNGYIDKQYQNILKQFISDRKIPSEYKLFIATKGEYKGRIIVPIIDGEKIIYFQGRSTNLDDFLKYKNPEVEKSLIIMNKSLFKRDKFIIVTEGIIDAMMVEQNQGTPVIGGSVSDDFLSILFKLTDVGVIIAVDNDERGEQERNKLIERSSYGKQLFYYIPPNDCKDLNELKIKQNIDDMYEHVVSKKIDYWNYKIVGSI